MKMFSGIKTLDQRIGALVVAAVIFFAGMLAEVHKVGSLKAQLSACQDSLRVARALTARPDPDQIWMDAQPPNVEKFPDSAFDAWAADAIWNGPVVSPRVLSFVQTKMVLHSKLFPHKWSKKESEAIAAAVWTGPDTISPFAIETNPGNVTVTNCTFPFDWDRWFQHIKDSLAQKQKYDRMWKKITALADSIPANQIIDSAPW